jgi:esterase/lipase
MMNIKAFQGDEHRPFTLQGSNNTAAVLVHGFPGTPHEMRALAASLHNAGFTADVPLLPGFGADIETLPNRRTADWHAAIQTRIAEIRRDHAHVLLVGFSMGGALAGHVAAHTPIDALVLINPLSRMSNPLWHLMPIVKRVFPQVRPFKVIKINFDDPETRAGIMRFMPDADLSDPQVQQAIRDFAIPVGMFDQLRTAGEMAYAAAPHIHVPTLIIQAEDDVTISPAMTRKFAARFRQPPRYVVLQGDHPILNPNHISWNDLESVVLQFSKVRNVNHKTIYHELDFPQTANTP